MLSKLLGVSNETDTVGLEETRMRAATLLSKVLFFDINLKDFYPTLLGATLCQLNTDACCREKVFTLLIFSL